MGEERPISMSRLSTDPLIQNAVQLLETATGKNAWRPHGRVVKGRKCAIQRFVTPHSGHEAALKVYFPGALKSDHMPQYDALVRFAEHADLNREYTVPRVYACWEEEQAFLMEWAQEPRLHRLLWLNMSRPQKQLEYVRRSVSWLRRYHGAGGIQDEPLDTRRYFSLLQRVVERNLGQELAERQPTFKHAVAALEAGLERLHGRLVPYALAHGDFTPTNILVGKRRTVGIDLWAYEHQPVVDDMARIMSHLLIGYPSLLGRSELARDPECWAVTRCMLESYGPPLDARARELFRHVLLYQLLRRWVIIRRRLATQLFRPLDHWRLSKIMTVVEALSDRLT